MAINKQQLETALQGHDWFWKYADDDATYTRGKFERDYIHNMMVEIGKDDAEPLWNQWAPQKEKGTFPNHLF